MSTGHKAGVVDVFEIVTIFTGIVDEVGKLWRRRATCYKTYFNSP